VSALSSQYKIKRNSGRKNRGVRASTGKDSAGKRFFKKSLKASKGSTLEEQRAWRSALYGEVMQLEGKAELSLFWKHAMPRVLAVQASTGTLMSTCRGKRIRNCASRSRKSVLTTVATVLVGSSLNHKGWA
jgi:hypothetical protein